MPYLGKRSLIAPDSYGSSSWQLADEDSATLLHCHHCHHKALRSSCSSSALHTEHLRCQNLSLFSTIRKTKWKCIIPVSLAAKERNKEQDPWRGLSDVKELKSTQGNLQIYIQSSPLWKPGLHSWHPIFLAYTPCKIDQYELVTSSSQERGDGTTGDSMHAELLSTSFVFRGRNFRNKGFVRHDVFYLIWCILCLETQGKVIEISTLNPHDNKGCFHQCYFNTPSCVRLNMKLHPPTATKKPGMLAADDANVRLNPKSHTLTITGSNLRTESADSR